MKTVVTGANRRIAKKAKKVVIPLYSLPQPFWKSNSSSEEELMAEVWASFFSDKDHLFKKGV
jgi:hypothetical protein